MKSVFSRFRSKHKVSDAGCWPWSGFIESNGYGGFSYRGAKQYAHRVSYSLYRGKIKEGLVIDHLCRNRSCVNPGHLDLVTQRENILRGDCLSVNRKRYKNQTHCKNGHPLSGENLYVHLQRGTRSCRTCKNRRTEISNNKRREGIKK
jgi:hypothetical protein